MWQGNHEPSVFVLVLQRSAIPLEEIGERRRNEFTQRCVARGQFRCQPDDQVLAFREVIAHVARTDAELLCHRTNRDRVDALVVRESQRWDEMSEQLPHTIDNGHGERLTFLEIVERPEGETLLVENEVAPGCGPIMHVHHVQEESLTVREGRLGYQFDGEDEQTADVGETVVFPAGRPHRFWADGDETLRCDGYVRPPDNVVWFLGEVYRSTAASENGRPDDFDSAFLLGRYRGEYDLPGIPSPVRRLVFPVLRAIGARTGRFERFGDAPEPVHG